MDATPTTSSGAAAEPDPRISTVIRAQIVP